MSEGFAACNENENRYHSYLMRLAQLEPGCSARVERIEGGHGLQERLGQLGIHINDVVTLESRGALRGPILVRVHGMRVALGRGVSHRIHVSPLDQGEGGRHGHLRRGIFGRTQTSPVDGKRGGRHGHGRRRTP